MVGHTPSRWPNDKMTEEGGCLSVGVFERRSNLGSDCDCRTFILILRTGRVQTQTSTPRMRMDNSRLRWHAGHRGSDWWLMMRTWRSPWWSCLERVWQLATHAGHLHRHALLDSWPGEACLVTAQRPQENAPFHFSRGANPADTPSRGWVPHASMRL